MRKTIFYSLALMVLASTWSNQAKAQTDEVAVKAVIQTLFDGMREADSSKVHSAFIDEAIMQTIAPRRDKMTLMNGSLENFLKSIATPHPKVYDERVSSYEIKIDGPMAAVWTPYQFYLGEDFSHCGVNSFQLMKTESGWKIIYLVDTRRPEDCK